MSYKNKGRCLNDANPCVFPYMKSSIGTVCIKWKGLGKERDIITKQEVLYKKRNFIT
jgi:hypothetical protein